LIRVVDAVQGALKERMTSIEQYGLDKPETLEKLENGNESP